MGVSVSLGSTTLEVVPGEEVVLTANVRNTGPVVDQVSFDVMGPAAGWSVIEPPVLNLYPGDSGQVRVHFRPPRKSEPGAGPVPFGFKAIPLEDPRGSVVEEGTVVVAPFTELRVTLLPQISRGSRRGLHKVDIANLGNIAVGTEISVTDLDDALTFDVQKAAAVAEPGLVTRTKLVATPRDKFWSGAQQQKPFEIVVAPDRGDSVSVNGTFEQDPLVPRWVLATAAAVMIIALVLAGLWATVFKQAVESAATEAAKVEASKAVAAQNDALAAANKSKSGSGADDADKKTPEAVPPSPSIDPDNPPLTKQIDFRIVGAATVGGTNYKTFDHPPIAGKPFEVTDVFLQNPALDQGMLQVRRNNTVIHEWGLGNHANKDEHYGQPLRFAKTDKLTIAVICNNPEPEKKKCTAAVTFAGRTVE
jgi:hypothetical protein